MEAPKVLVVGAGGIGCELLKNLVLAGYARITVVDLDMIDKTNLNRQFLFRRQDVGRSKAETAARVLKGLRPDLDIEGIRANVCEFGTEFFQGFEVVFNALDNLEARRFVNRMCVFLDKPLIDAGTKAKNGQVSVHVPKVSLCYDCEPKPVPKQYAVCTIRSTPSTPEHCIAWGKYLYEAMFGPEDPSNILSDLAVCKNTPAKEVFSALFAEGLPEKATSLNFECPTDPNYFPDNEVLDIKQLTEGFVKSFEALKGKEAQKFDKNHKDAVQFVAAASNLRCLSFGIMRVTTSKAQEIAGNIVPAIGSTNAIVAGLQVIESFKLIAKQECYGTVWLHPEPSSNKFIVPEKASMPNPSCFVCSAGKCNLHIDFSKCTLEKLVNEILIGQMNFKEPTLVCNGCILFETGEGIDEEDIEIYQKRMKLTLKEMGLKDGEEICCDV